MKHRQVHAAQSLLDVLKAPTKSSLSGLESTTWKMKTSRKLTNDPKSVKPAQHVKEYKDEPFTVSNCKLYTLYGMQARDTC